jgi:hypothetical protein
MASQSAAGLLEVWESGADRHAVDQALLLLAAGFPHASPAELASLSLGDRNRRLLSLRESLFGGDLAGIASCPGCGDRVEFALDLATLQSDAPTARPMQVEVDGTEHRVRPLDSLDLAAVVGCEDVETARWRLAARALLSGPDELTEEVVDRVAECLERGDMASEFLLGVACPACGHAWHVDLDIGAFVWTEVAGEAARLLQEVAGLARAYAWREADILAMSASRRRFYLDAAS